MENLIRVPLGVWYPHPGKTPLATFSVNVAGFGANDPGQAVVSRDLRYPRTFHPIDRSRTINSLQTSHVFGVLIPVTFALPLSLTPHKPSESSENWDHSPHTHCPFSVRESRSQGAKLIQVRRRRRRVFCWLWLVGIVCHWGWNSPHNPKVGGSNPPPATN